MTTVLCCKMANIPLYTCITSSQSNIKCGCYQYILVLPEIKLCYRFYHTNMKYFVGVLTQSLVIGI